MDIGFNPALSAYVKHYNVIIDDPRRFNDMGQVRQVYRNAKEKIWGVENIKIVESADTLDKDTSEDSANYQKKHQLLQELIKSRDDKQSTKNISDINLFNEENVQVSKEKYNQQNLSERKSAKIVRDNIIISTYKCRNGKSSEAHLDVSI